MSSVAAIGLSKRFGSETALHLTDLAVADGEFVVIVGPSGCGKSTLLRLLAGLDPPTTGEVWIGERDVTALDPADRDLAMVFQSYALYPHLSVAENIGFPLKVAGWNRREATARVAEVAASLDLTPLLGRRPRALSGGQRQRVSIGRALARSPGVLLLDEPLSNLDTALRVRMRHEFARLHQQTGMTMLYVTHDQLEAMTLANRIVVMAHGRIEQAGAPMDLYARPATLEVARAIGSPAMNLLDVRIVAAHAGGATVGFPGGDQCRVAAQVPAADIGKSATFGVRPEHLTPDAGGIFGGHVELFERLGPLSFAHLSEGGGSATVVAQLPGDRAIVLDEWVRFSVAAGDAHLFAANGAAYPRFNP